MNAADYSTRPSQFFAQEQSPPRFIYTYCSLTACDLLHAVLHYDVGVRRAGAATCRGGLHRDGQRSARGVILRDRSAIVGGSGDGEVHGRRSIREPHDGIGATAAWG